MSNQFIKKYYTMGLTSKSLSCELNTFPEEGKLHFTRGFIETHGIINVDDIVLTLECKSEKLLNDVCIFSDTPMVMKSSHVVIFQGVNMIDFLGRLYTDCEEFYTEGFYNTYKQLLSYDYRSQIVPRCKIYTTDTRAIIPYKSRISDVGFDLTIIEHGKRYNDKTVLYSTGIKLDIPFGYYAEIVPRSSLSKTGYILANSVGIIDNSYRGTLYVPLTKIDENAPDIKLPFRCCQLIFRKQVFMELDDCTHEEISTTLRGDGGFGSTG
jgi:dUTP pyrophosphatase